MSDYPLTLLYDGACPLCLAEMERLMMRNRRSLLRFVDASAPGFDAVHYGTTQAEVMRVIHGVRPDGSLLQGVSAIRLAYAAAGLGGIARLLGLPGIRQAANWAYPRIANNRYALSRRFRWLIAALRGKSGCDGESCAVSDRTG
jgi:predicted DCC family thiol-disulfide oxidoreductase YuxK